MNNLDQSKNDFPIMMLQKVSRYQWVVLFVFIILGGILGYSAGFFLRPIYEAQSQLTANVDIKEERPKITELMVDMQILHIGELMYHPDIIQALLDQNELKTTQFSLEKLHAMADIERQGMSTLIKIRSENPRTAAIIANSWGELAFKRLEEAEIHAIKASEARKKIAMLNYCFPTTPDNSPPDGILVDRVQFCKGLTFKEANSYLNEANQTLIEEDSQTLGLSSSLNLSLFTPSPIPSKPIRNSQGMLTFSGALIGLVIGLIGINLLDIKRST